ncbi:MAG: CHRD domain-containing protein [Acidobacteria bacterium]|nr:CHRD domain-containing protein [Acidobacteriota bacterium]
MHRFRVLAPLAALLAAAAGCGGDSPTAPSPGSIVFTAQLSAQNEVPPIGNAESGALGSVTIMMDVQRGASDAITSATASFSASLLGFPPGSTAILAHIHEGGSGVAGGVRVNTGLTPATGISMPNGSGVISVAGVNVPVNVANAMVANPAGFYFNVHTPVNPGGAVRGQLVRQ